MELKTPFSLKGKPKPDVFSLKYMSKKYNGLSPMSDVYYQVSFFDFVYSFEKGLDKTIF